MRSVSQGATKTGLYKKADKNGGRSLLTCVEFQSVALATNMDASDSSPLPLFKRSTKAKARPKREKSPTDSSIADVSLSIDHNDSDVSFSADVSPMTQVAKLKQKARKRIQSRLSFGADESDVSI